MRTKHIFTALLVGLGALAWSCSDDTASPQVDYGPLLRTLTANAIMPEHDAFAQAADALGASLHDLESTPSADTLAKAQTAWRTARAAYRRLDALHFGPVADLGISERIDVSPVSPTDVDAIVAKTTPIDASTVENAGGRAKGFLGIEYLLFSTDGNAAVLSRLSGDGAAARRRTLARAMADEIASSAHQLLDAWTPGKGGYQGDVENAGSTSARYPTQRAAIDDVVGGAAYALEVVVGIRLAMPLGRKSGGTPDPSLDPTPASDSAAADMKASLEGVKALYDGQGLSSRVRTKSTVLDDRFEGQIGDCAAKITAIPQPFDTALKSDTASVQAAYDACKAAKATWNTDVTSALGATLKPSDNDGD